MERIKIFKNMPFALIDDDFDEMMIWAVRYSIGRRTYAAGDTCRYVKSVLPYMNYKTLHAIKKDIEDHEDESSPFYGLGDECDKVEWLELKKEIVKQIGRMVEDAL